MAVVNGTIAASGDDGQIYYDGGNQLDATASVIWYGNYGDTPDLAFVRFTLDGAITSGATITTTAGASAITFRGVNANAVTSAYVYVTESADAPAIAAGSDAPTWANSGGTTTYPTTMANANAIHWTGSWDITDYATNVIDIGPLVQHLVDTYSGIASGAQICFWVDGDRDETSGDENGFASYDNLSNLPTLQITYTAGGGVVSGAGTSAGVSAFTGAGVRSRIGIGAIAVLAGFMAAGTVLRAGAGTITGTTAISGVGTRIQSTSGAIAAQSSFTGAGTVTAGGVEVSGAGVIGATSSFAGTGIRGQTGAGVVSGVSSFGGVGTKGLRGAGVISGVSSLTASGTRGVQGTGSIAGISTITGTGNVYTIKSGSGSIDAVSTFTGKGYEVSAFLGEIHAVSSFSATGQKLCFGRGSIAAVSLFAGTTTNYTVANKSVYVKMNGTWVEISPPQSVVSDADGGTW